MRYPLLGSLITILGIGVALAGGVPRDVSKYVQALKSSTNAKERAEAADIIGKRGVLSLNAVADAIPILKDALKDKDASVRAASAIALGKIHPYSKDIVPTLIDMVKSEEKLNNKLSIVYALGLFGSDAKEAVPTLRELAREYQGDKKDKKIAKEIQMSIQNITGAKKK